MAAEYCNWLSAQAGLTQVYEEKIDAKSNEKTWTVNLARRDFTCRPRPQWESVASGRGEGRKYPWGNEAPVSGKHGNFRGGESLDPDLRLSSLEGGGATVVGSFPAGASRDGVMDMAGNVCQWCSDCFNPYAAGEQTDPCDQAASNFRSIRGGSWGYYGLSQRSADREFNTPNYGGYIYVGLRVAVSEAGYKKLLSRR